MHATASTPRTASRAAIGRTIFRSVYSVAFSISSGLFLCGCRRRHVHHELEALGANGVVCRAHESRCVASRLLHAVETDSDALAVIPGIVYGQVAMEHIPQVAI